MTESVAESPETAYYVGHKESFLTGLTPPYAGQAWIFRMFYLLLFARLPYLARPSFTSKPTPVK